MSKLKISLSAFLMLLFLGMFAGLASAEGFDPSNTTHPSDNIYTGDVDNFGNPNTHKTHGNFQNNTNSCANCHSTHNGDDSALLMKGGEYELCMSCHDGTLGFYDVTKATEAAGVIDSHELSASMHQVNSDLQEKAAPGALKNTSSSTFECSSCHNPHGSANPRLLNETVAGNAYGYTYDVYLNNATHEERITKLAPVAKGTPSIALQLTEDTKYDAINKSTTLSGLKIYKSDGVNPNDYNSKLNYSAFCASCHDDYLKNRETEVRADGHYTHTTSSTKQGRSCTACHYPHGTDITLLKDTAGRTIADYTKPVADGGQFGWSKEKAEAYMKDVTKGKDGKPGSSNLKKFTNMAVCWACHQSTHQIDSQGAVDLATKKVLVPLPGSNFDGKNLIK